MDRNDVAFGLLLAMSVSEHRGSADAVAAEAFKRADAFLAQCEDDDLNDNPQAGGGGFDFEIDESELDKDAPAGQTPDASASA